MLLIPRSLTRMFLFPSIEFVLCHNLPLLGQDNDDLATHGINFDAIDDFTGTPCAAQRARDLALLEPDRTAARAIRFGRVVTRSFGHGRVLIENAQNARSLPNGLNG